MNKLTTITYEGKTMAFSDVLSASIAKEVLRHQSVDFDASETVISTNIEIEVDFKDWQFEGVLTYHPDEDQYLSFEGGVSYDGEECKITWVKYTDCYDNSVSLPDVIDGQIRLKIELKIEEKYNPTMYQMWQDDQHENFLDREFEASREN